MQIASLSNHCFGKINADCAFNTASELLGDITIAASQIEQSIDRS